MGKNEFEGEWKISTSAKPIEFENIVTPTFTPFSGKNISFCFEAWYQEVANGKSTLCLFKLKLVNLFHDSFFPISDVVVDVKVYYSDRTLFIGFLKKSFDGGRKYLTFSDAVREMFANVGPSDHSIRMRSNTLIIKCKMSFLDHVSNTAVTNEENYLQQLPTANEEKSCKGADVMRNLKSIYEPSVLSDFEFKVGDKSLPAHRIILAAHSPVFMKMMTHEFLESKTNSVTITDATPEVFDLFLRSLYGGELKNKTWDSLKELYYLVDKYDVGFLKVQCTEAAISLLSVDSVCETLKLAYNFSDSELKTATINFAVSHIKKIVVREDWKDLVKTHPNIGYEVTVNFIPK